MNGWWYLSERDVFHGDISHKKTDGAIPPVMPVNGM
jgi:hypothetical protein